MSIRPRKGTPSPYQDRELAKSKQRITALEAENRELRELLTRSIPIIDAAIAGSVHPIGTYATLYEIKAALLLPAATQQPKEKE